MSIGALKCDKCHREEKLGEVSIRVERGIDFEKKLCTDCMEKMDIYWDYDSFEFVDAYATCPDCGGMMSWCTCCNMYSQNCCVDYGTCQCS
jgi:hypothetical protein